MVATKNEPPASIEISPDQHVLYCTGDWSLSGLFQVELHIKRYVEQAAQATTISAQDITKMDSAGALLFYTLISRLQSSGKSVKIQGLNQNTETLLNLVKQEADVFRRPPTPPLKPGFIYWLGEGIVIKWISLINFLTFIGEASTILGYSLLQLRRIQWRAMWRTVEETGYRALSIVALLSFLVGIVLTYQIALQLDSYSVDIFVVDITGTVIFLEFGPLITAIIAAGRTSTAFTAQISTMKVNEEIDALNTMGVSPLEYLVLPKIFALLISLILLTAWADIFAVFGSMFIAKSQLDIGYMAYLDRLQHAIPVRHYVVGLIKAPVFALIIAAVGCFQGFQVDATADSVGQRTTQSAVQSIFLIIIADAIFSVLFRWLGI
ncbi:MAG: MlaE family ABC transporter permease [Coxiella endosymbiont of Haemaphysalis qinghaiensis]